MFIVPLNEFIDLSSNYNEVLIDDGFNYIINFLFQVVEGSLGGVYVCGITREGSLGLKVQFFNRSQTSTKIRLYKILDPHILATNHKSDNPAVIGTKKNFLKIPVGYTEIPMVIHSIEEIERRDLYHFLFQIIDGSKQIHVANMKLDSIHSVSLLTLGFSNSGQAESIINLNILSVDFQVCHSSEPPPMAGIDLKEVGKQEITIDSNSSGKIEIPPSKPNATILHYTFNNKSEKKNAYVCGQYWNEKVLIIEFFNESTENATIEVSGWETYPYESN